MDIPKKRAGRKPKAALTIALDCGSLLSTSGSFSGIATVTHHLLEALSVIDKRNNYLLYSFTPIDKNFLVRFGGRVNNVVFWPARGYLRIQLPLALARSRPDVFLALSQAVPPLAPPTIGFVYDIGFITYPNLYPHAASLRAKTERLMQVSDSIVTTSQHSKTEIINTLKVKPECISVCYPGAPYEFNSEGLKYVGHLPYFLFVGHLKPSKNIPRILTAFAQFLSEHSERYQLVMIGNRKDEDPEIKKTIAYLKLESSVIFLGQISQEELAKYYRGALAFLSPSLVEGFGLPILEALSSGTPVITSTISAASEIVGNAGILVEPTDTGAIKKAINLLVSDVQLQKKLRRMGIQRARFFSWKSFAKQILTLVEKTKKNGYNETHV